MKQVLKRSPAIVLGMVIGLCTTPALAVHDDGTFELGDVAGTPGSGDILGSVTQPGPDWADLFDANGENIDSNLNGTPDCIENYGGVACAFGMDQNSIASNTDDTVFANSNKNDDLIGTWNWDTGNVPTKDDQINAYVYAKFVNGKLRIYGGVERAANNGDAHVDIEFNQNSIGLDKDPPCGSDGTAGPGDGSPCEFTGEKKTNDIVVSMDFLKGGGLGSVSIHRWNGLAFEELLTLNGEGCNPAINGYPADTVCAFNNGVSIPGGPWVNLDSHANEITDIPPNGFTEFGADLGDLIPQVSVCYATVNFKTRSSQSFSSELKDFSLHAFEECSATVTTEVRNASDEKLADDMGYTSSIPVKTTIHDTAKVTGIAGVIPTGSVTFALYDSSDCSGTPVNATFDTVALPGVTTPETVSSKDLTPSSAGVVAFMATYSGDNNYPSAESGCEPLTVNTVNSSVNTKVLLSGTTTDVTNKALDVGTKVQDKAIVMGQTGLGDPTGNVKFRRFENADCTGAYSDETVALSGAGGDMSTALSSEVTLSSEAFSCWQVCYEGSNVYKPSCSNTGEPICTFDFDPDISSLPSSY